MNLYINSGVQAYVCTPCFFVQIAKKNAEIMPKTCDTVEIHKKAEKNEKKRKIKVDIFGLNMPFF